mgnify:CR=1 FL=1
MTLRHSADHLIPVFENPDIGPFLARCRAEELRDPTLVTRPERILSRFSSYLYPMHQPMYWRIPPGHYMSSWVRSVGWAQPRIVLESFSSLACFYDVAMVGLDRVQFRCRVLPENYNRQADFVPRSRCHERGGFAVIREQRARPHDHGRVAGTGHFLLCEAPGIGVFPQLCV